MDKKEQTRQRVKRYRDKKKALPNVTVSVTLSPESVTHDVTQSPAILLALTDSV